MTPQEKSKELVYKYMGHSQFGLISAKQCALICVDELLMENELNGWPDAIQRSYKYWNEVKEEINKL
jgi:hypothetical protein